MVIYEFQLEAGPVVKCHEGELVRSQVSLLQNISKNFLVKYFQRDVTVSCEIRISVWRALDVAIENDL